MQKFMQLSIPSAGRTGMKQSAFSRLVVAVLIFQYPQRVVPG